MAYPRAELKTGHLSFFVFFLFLAIFLNLFRLQVLKSEYYRDLSERNRLRVLYLEPPRGKILDRRGRMLATSRLSFNCTVIPREAKNTVHETIQVIAPILKQEPSRLEEMYKRKRLAVSGSVLLAEDILPAQAMAIEEMLDTLPGVMIETKPQREYPYQEA